MKRKTMNNYGEINNKELTGETAVEKSKSNLESKTSSSSENNPEISYQNQSQIIGDNSLPQPFQMNKRLSRYPHSVVWTPLPIITWIFPIIGHMGIAYTNGVIRDFAGPYSVGEDDMAFGKPTKYWVLDLNNVEGGGETWDKAVFDASEVYKGRMHNLFCDNCHSHTAMALNLMRYKNSKNYNMIWLWFYMLLYGKYVSFGAFLKTNLPFLILVTIFVCIAVFLR